MSISCHPPRLPCDRFCQLIDYYELHSLYYLRNRYTNEILYTCLTKWGVNRKIEKLVNKGYIIMKLD